MQNLTKTYNDCIIKGDITSQRFVDTITIESMIIAAKSDLSVAEDLCKRKIIPMNTAYKLFYDSFHSLCEAFLRFDKIKTDSHQCLFACLCHNNSELLFEYEFLDKIRIKRNRLKYYGDLITPKDWQLLIETLPEYIATIIQIIENNLLNMKLSKL